MKRRSSILAAAALALVVPALGTGTAGATLGIARWTVDGGGATQVAGGSLRLGGTIGQPDAGSLAGGTLTLLGGFWKGGVAASAVSPGPGSEAARPLAFHVSGCAPSPFAGETRLRFDLPEPRPVRAAVLDLTGRCVRQLCARTFSGGSHEIRWDGRGDEGRLLPSGVYLVRIEAGPDRATRRLVWLAR